MNLHDNNENNVISIEDQIKGIQKHLHKIPLNFRETNMVMDMAVQKDYNSILLLLKRKGYSFEDIANGNFYQH
ncbi:hypothetical protein SAMN05660297_00733 [Natronincola peptidivorans]|uniref:Uncharacterized protein n=1 Tax=Natronincola peptidivorans TaxID=426128 RepID=A0A1H9ZUE7_9FIRM|nr:hypothetical protein [Natronincola peptidivorans]SES85410.1 hypothetical protein SAMN05660297_00733 [Natronincola peptidivorans]